MATRGQYSCVATDHIWGVYVELLLKPFDFFTQFYEFKKIQVGKYLKKQKTMVLFFKEM